jgi:hypothetical protein
MRRWRTTSHEKGSESYRAASRLFSVEVQPFSWQSVYQEEFASNCCLRFLSKYSVLAENEPLPFMTVENIC